MADLARVLDALDEAVAAASSLVDLEVVERAARVADRARRRVGFLGESVVVALVGGTGSGKSSLLNALSGTEVAVTGVLRPTTQTALAWLPHQPEPGLTRLLDALGVGERIGHELATPVCLLDMPDVDSVAGSHRDEVERLLPQVDAVIWVLDPEKYNDRVVHEDFLQHLTGYEHQFIFVLNQTDRVFEADRGLILDDLRRQLLDDGFSDPQVLPTAAAPDVGLPRGVDELWGRLRSLVADKRLVVDKLLEDVAGAARDLEEAAGLDRDVEWSELWAAAEKGSASALAEAAVSKPAVQTIQRAGRSRALARHPFGVTGLLRKGGVGRALALDQDLVRDLRRWGSSPQAARARQTVAEVVGGLAGRLRGRAGQTLASRFDDSWIHQQMDAAMDRTLRDVDPPAATASSAGLAGWLGLAAVVVGLVWWWAMPPERGETPWNLILVAGGILVVTSTRWLIRGLADRRSERSVVALRERLTEDVSHHLATLVGRPIERELRSRAELRAALATVGIEVARQKEDA